MITAAKHVSHLHPEVFPSKRIYKKENNDMNNRGKISLLMMIICSQIGFRIGFSVLLASAFGFKELKNEEISQEKKVFKH